MDKDPQSIAALQEEIARLRQQIADLEQEKTTDKSPSLPPATGSESDIDLTTFQKLVDLSPDGIGLADMQGNLYYANKAFRSMLKLDDSLENITLASFHTPEMLPLIEESIVEVRAHGHWRGELTYLRRDGSTFPGLALVYAMRDETGEMRGLAGIIQDLTLQQQQEQALRASEERFRTIIEKIPAGVCITTRDQLFEYVNPAYCQIYRYRAEELVGKPFTIVVPEENRDLMQRLHDEFMEDETEIRGEWDVQASDGSPLKIMADAAMIQGDDGQPRKATFVIDITEQRRSEEEREILQQQIIEAQRAAIRELSTPLIPLSNNVVLMPLIGSVDSQRAQMVMETLLEGVAEHQAETAIVDITGVSVVDTQVANALIQAAQAVRLLGARVVLTGIGPTMAQTLVHLGADLSSIVTRGSLQSAVVEALAASQSTDTSIVS